MHLAEIWRYPVKSLAGERLESVELTADGIPGDRAVHVRDGRGKVATGRRHYRLVTIPGTLDGEGVPLVSGKRWDSLAAARIIWEAAGDDARLAPSEGGALHDDTPLLVATDGAVEWLGEDGRRFRANLVIGGVEGLAEREWPGSTLRIGTALIGVSHLCERCAMTTVDPDTGEVDPSVLTRVRRDLEGEFALNCDVLEPGHVAVGDEVELLGRP
jgi:uncharacterized protein YcbX